MSDGPDKTDELYPIAVLIDELKVHWQNTASHVWGSSLGAFAHYEIA